jgi:hypothetical protein
MSEIAQGVCGVGVEEVCELPSAPFAMVVADLEGDGESVPIIGGFDGRLYAVRNDAPELLAEVGGWAMELDAADFDGDGRDEILCGAADNPSHLYLLRGDGSIVWKQTAERCWVCARVARSESGPVAIAADFEGRIAVFSPEGERLCLIDGLPTDDGGRRPLPTITALAAGDLDGDGIDEIVAAGYRGRFYAFRLDGEFLWSRDTWAAVAPADGGAKQPVVSVERHVTTNGHDHVIDLQRGGLFARHMRIADIDGDGRPEIVCGLFRSELYVADNEGRRKWSKVINDDVVDHMIRYVHMDQRGCHKDSVAKSQPCLVLVDRPDGKGKWIVALQPREDLMETTVNFGAADIFIFDGAGAVLRRDISGAPWFRLAVDPADGATIHLATGISESTLFRANAASLVENGSGIAKWTRVPRAVQNWTDALETLKDKPALPPSPSAADHKIEVIVLYDHCMYDHYFFSYEAVKHNILAMHREFNRPDIGPLEYVFRINLQEVAHCRSDTARGLFTREQYLDFFDYCEEHEIPTICWFSHIIDVNATVETMIAVAERGYRFLRGFIMVEGHLGHFKSERFDAVREILPHFKRAGMKFYLNTTGGAWTEGLLDDESGVAEMLAEFSDTFVPMVKMNNSHVPEMETGAVLALWKAGWVGQWSNASLDQWTWTNISRNNPYTPSSLMGTLDLAYLALGANPIVYYQSSIRVDRDEKGFIRRIERMIPETVHMKVIEQMIARNIIEPVDREQVLGLSPLLFSTVPDQNADSLAHTLPESTSPGCASGVLEKPCHFQRVNENCASAIFYGSRAASACAIAPTPCGVYGILPKSLCGKKIAGVSEALETDRRVVLVDGKPLSSDDSARHLREAMARHADSVAFASDDAFVAAQRFGERNYRVFVIDPGYEKQTGGEYTVRCNLDAAIVTVRDRVSGEEIAHEGNVFRAKVAAGLFRILDVETLERRDPLDARAMSNIVFADDRRRPGERRFADEDDYGCGDEATAV